jgi:hypothetical protein
MTSDERDRLAALEVRLFGLDGEGGLYGKVVAIETEVSEWRGAMRLVRGVSAIVGLSGIAVLARALYGS